MQDEGIGGQLEPEMGGAAAPAHPQQPRTYADRIAMGTHTTSCGICLLAVATYISDKCILHLSCIAKKGVVQCQTEIGLIAGAVVRLLSSLGCLSNRLTICLCMF